MLYLNHRTMYNLNFLNIMNYQLLVFDVKFVSEGGHDIAKFKLTIPEFPKEGWIIKINESRFEVHSIEQIDYSNETAVIFLK